MRKALAQLLPLALAGAASPPPAVHLNKIGFRPDTAKWAILSDDAKAPLPWRVVDASGKAVAEGKTQPFGDDAASGDHVHQIDLSAVRVPGTYRLTVDGVTSHPFAIKVDTYAPLARAALNFFYQNRAGIAIDARYAGGPQWARAAGHPHEVATCFAGRDTAGTVWPGCRYTLDVTGGWYDAGDHGK